MRRTFVALLVLLVVAAPAAAQRRTAAGAFAIEAFGGTAGSAAGVGIGYALSGDCGTEELTCHLQSAGVTILAGTALAATGAYLAGRLGETEPAGLGAVLGSIAGAGAGIGLWHLLAEELDVLDSEEAAILTYALTQGLVTALGSRLVRALRD